MELGRTAARLVIDEATNARHEHQQKIFEPELVVRASTVAAPPAQPVEPAVPRQSR
jgi:LacI family transcriptional regulator